ncbi:transcriptional regulator [Streptomyces spiroverticillatus]|uniref:Transcriptional regulator n=1 Tax=Streptomyces finlayi TaxID=67296 RepID=A0A919C8Q1_9ACTN|nr:AraC family transcriptional regulator [Streptomyces finlayi]GHA01467.1 transcriptional regulator [Streptomyces spiroverticillatus]GHC85869.1 transcriptional regulator [Streptomyces finlayi]
MVVKKRQPGASGTPGIPEVRFHAPGGAPAGLEVLTLATLRTNACAHSISATHRPDFHHLLRVESGALPLMVDFASYRVLPGEWLWVRPGQVHRWDDLFGAEGTLVLFEAGFPDPATSAAARLDDPFGPTVRHPSAAGDAAAGRALGQLHAEYRTLRDAGSAPELPPDAHLSVLRHLLAVLLLRLAHTGEPSAGCDNPDAFLRFRAAVERDFARTRRVDDYARELGYAPRTLSRATLSAAGVGAKEFIDRRVVLEAKRLLAHSDHSASRVAALLGFRDAANFGKFFHQRTGESPLGFRATARGGAV